MWLARISLTLSLHVSLSFIAFGRSSGLHPVSSHSCCMNVRAGHPAFDWPYAGVHRSTSLTISSLLLQQCPACLVRLACIVFMIGGRWPYSWRHVGCCCQDLFNIARKINSCNTGQYISSKRLYLKILIGLEKMSMIFRFSAIICLSYYIRTLNKFSLIFHKK